jgi:O-antigen/teichoic acid export membrane protein
MTQAKTIAKNVSSNLVSKVIGEGLNVFIVIFIARYLGITGFGNYSFVMAFVFAFRIIADSGISNILVREISTHKEEAGKYFGAARSLLWVLSALTVGLIAVVITIINPSRAVVISTYIMGLTVVSTFLAIGYGSVCMAFEEMEFNAYGFVLHKIVLFLFTYLSIRQDYGLQGIFASYLLSSLSLWIYYYSVVRWRYFKPRSYFDKSKWWFFIKEAFPLGVATILRNFTWQVDILILSALATAMAVGIFSAPYKIIAAMNQFTITLALALFPVFSRLAKKSMDDLFINFSASLKYMFLISIPLVTFTFVLSDRIIQIAFGAKFLPSVQALQILSFVGFFLFPSSLYMYFFTAIGKQRLYTICAGACLGLNVIVDFILVPRFTYIGACIGTLLSEFIMFYVGYFSLLKLGWKVKIFHLLWKPLFISAIIGGFLYSIRGFSIPVLGFFIVVSLLFYIAGVYLLKVFSPYELSVITDVVMFWRKTSRSQ